MNIARVRVDIAKSTFHIHAADRDDQCQRRSQCKRGPWLAALYERVRRRFIGP